MALLILSGLITNITGKLGGSYFSKKKGSPSLNRCGSKLTKADSGRTALQAAQNALVSTARNWKLLEASNRLAWQSFAATLTWINKAGIEYTPSGYEVYMSCNSNLNTIGLPPIGSPITSSGGGEIASAGIGWNLAGELVFKYPPAAPANQGVIIFASSPQAAGVSRPKGGYKKIYASDSFVSGDTILGAAYSDVFGYAPPFGVMFFKIVFIVPDSGIQNGSKLTKADSGFL